YPLIFDGLALVAYRTAGQLKSRLGQTYAASVVVLCTGLSACAQAAHLAAGAGLGAAATTQLRAGVGAAPALPVSLAVHLHWLVTRPKTVVQTPVQDTTEVSYLPLSAVSDQARKDSQDKQPAARTPVSLVSGLACPGVSDRRTVVSVSTES